MKHKIWMLWIMICIMLITPAIQVSFTDEDEAVIRPVVKNEGSSDKQRRQETPISRNCTMVLGICQSIEDPESTNILYYTLKGLEQAGWIDDFDYPFVPYETTSQAMWDFACENVTSDVFILKKENHYDIAVEGSSPIRKAVCAGDIDLLLTYGTKAGQIVFSEDHHVNTLNFGANDPVEAGFIESEDYSGASHLWAHTDNTRYYRQLKMFYDVAQFEKLGVIRYVDSFRRVFTPEEDIERLAKEKGFEIEYLDVFGVDSIFDKDDLKEYYKKMMQAHEELAEEVDAFYMVIGGWSYDDLPELLAPFYERSIPVFSQFGSVEVEHGALMSVGKTDFDEIGDFASNVIVQVIAGIKPGDILQRHSEIQSIAYNVDVARQIEFQPDMEFLIYCNEVYRERVKR